jgi:hypothetical protein
MLNAAHLHMPLELGKPWQNRTAQLSDIAEALHRRADEIDAWLAEIGGSCKVEQKHCKEGTVERTYWHYGYMMALRDVLDLLERNSKPLS